MSLPTSPSRPRVLLFRLAVVALVAAAAAPIVLASKQVAVRIDGRPASLRTDAETVGELLDDRGIELAAADVVVPPPSTPLDDGMAVTVVRAIDVHVVVAGRERIDLRTTQRSVAAILVEAGLGTVPGAEVAPARTSMVDDGSQIIVRLPSPVTFVVDGEVSGVATTARTVAAALAEAGIELGPKDLIEPALTSRIDGETTISIQRVDEREEIEEVVLERSEERREDPSMYKGRTTVVDAGADGLRHDVYLVRYVDGVEVERTLLREEVVSEPRPRIVAVGTKPLPPPPSPGDIGIWYDLAQCESGGRWHLDGTYDGGLQFHPDTWRRWKPSGYPEYAYQATPEQQIAVGQRLQRARGWHPWPSCARKLGLL